MLKIAIIIGSTRPGRNGEVVAKWVYEIAQKRSDAEFDLVDIKDFNLPLLDEPVPAAMGNYSKPHTKAWGAKDRFIRRLGLCHARVQPRHEWDAQERHRLSLP